MIELRRFNLKSNMQQTRLSNYMKAHYLSQLIIFTLTTAGIFLTFGPAAGAMLSTAFLFHFIEKNLPTLSIPLATLFNINALRPIIQGALGVGAIYVALQFGGGFLVPALTLYLLSQAHQLMIEQQNIGVIFGYVMLGGAFYMGLLAQPQALMLAIGIGIYLVAYKRMDRNLRDRLNSLAGDHIGTAITGTLWSSLRSVGALTVLGFLAFAPLPSSPIASLILVSLLISSLPWTISDMLKIDFNMPNTWSKSLGKMKEVVIYAFSGWSKQEENSGEIKNKPQP